MRELKAHRVFRSTSLGVLVATLFGGCASTVLEGQWVDSQRPAGTLRSATVLLVCEAYEPLPQQLCSDRFAAAWSAQGTTVVVAPPFPGVPAGRPMPSETYLPAARAAGARALLVVSIATGEPVQSQGVSVGISLGGLFGHGSFGGVGISAPIGTPVVQSGYAASSRLDDVETGRVIWSAKATTPPSADLNAQFGALASTLAEGARKSGLF